MWMDAHKKTVQTMLSRGKWPQDIEIPTLDIDVR